MVDQQLSISSIPPLLPNMCKQPWNSQWPNGSPNCMGLWRGISESIGIMVTCKAACTVHFPRSYSTLLSHSFNHIKQRKLSFGQITWATQPIIHLGIDVYCVFGAPNRINFVTPYSLQVRWKSSRLARRNKQIPSKIKGEL